MSSDLGAAWQRVDDRVAALRNRHSERGDIPLYSREEGAPATDAQLLQVASTLALALPVELQLSLKRWNGRWIAQDHAIYLAPTNDYLRTAKADTRYGEAARALARFEEVRGPINKKMESRRRICFGSHDRLGAGLYLDFEDPPAGGHLGQVIRIGEEPIAEFVAPSFVEFLKLVAEAPIYEDDPDLDPLRWRG